MSEHKRCDACGRESPDEKGLYLANHWIRIKKPDPKNITHRWEWKLIICDQCAAIMFDAVKLKGRS